MYRRATDECAFPRDYLKPGATFGGHLAIRVTFIRKPLPFLESPQLSLCSPALLLGYFAPVFDWSRPCNPPADTPPPVGVHEEGGWIYLNLITGALTMRRAAAGGQANINLGGPPKVKDSIVAGTFHTHPNVGPCWGAVFPSGTDTNSANNTGVLWLIIGAFPTVAATQTTSTGPAQRLHLARDRGFPGASGGEAPQATVDDTYDEV